MDEAVLREWLVNIGQRDAFERIAHLIVELYLRLKAVCLVTGTSFDLPLTQEQIGDTTGLTGVHVNRVMQRLRVEGLIRSARGCMHIPDVEQLKRVSKFDMKYLHFNRRVDLI